MDRVQARLAWHIRLTDEPNSRGGSILWRDGLKGLTFSERLVYAQNLLQAASKDARNMPDKLTLFMLSAEAMQLAVEAKSPFRDRGNDVAHHDLTKSQFTSIVDEHCKMGGTGKYEVGLRALVQFLFP